MEFSSEGSHELLRYVISLGLPTDDGTDYPGLIGGLQITDYNYCLSERQILLLGFTFRINYFRRDRTSSVTVYHTKDTKDYKTDLWIGTRWGSTRKFSTLADFLQTRWIRESPIRFLEIWMVCE